MIYTGHWWIFGRTRTGRRFWDKLTLFYGYYRAIYAPEELRRSFYELVESGEAAMRQETGAGKLRSDAHEVFPELEIEQVFLELVDNEKD